MSRRFDRWFENLGTPPPTVRVARSRDLAARFFAGSIVAFPVAFFAWRFVAEHRKDVGSLGLGVVAALGIASLTPLLVGRLATSRRRMTAFGAAFGILAGAIGGYQSQVIPDVGSDEIIAEESLAGVAALNQEVLRHVLLLDDQLQIYGHRRRTANAGAYPPAANFIRHVRAADGGPAALISPWGGTPQARVIGVAGLALPSAREVARGTLPPPTRSPLGAGKMPTTGPFDGLTFGAVIYDYDAASDSYVMYGVGQEGDRAVLLVATHN